MAEPAIYYGTKDEQRLVDAILALAPMPPREGLIKIFKTYTAWYIQSISNPSKGSPTLIDEIMAWATGQPTTPVWCKHWAWENDRWYATWRPDLSLYPESNARFDICPVQGCHAKRPEGG